MPVLPGQHRGRELTALLKLLLQRVGNELNFFLLPLEELHLHVACRSVLAWLQRRDGSIFPAAKDRGGDLIRHLKHLARVTPGDGQLFLLRRHTARGREIFHECREVFRRRPAPAVDCLHRVAHRSHRQRGVLPLAEQAAQQHSLRMRGVLVLVEHDHAVLLPLRSTDGRVLLRERGRNVHLLVERDHTTLTQRRVKLLNQRQHQLALALLVAPPRHGLAELGFTPRRLR